MLINFIWMNSEDLFYYLGFEYKDELFKWSLSFIWGRQAFHSVIPIMMKKLPTVAEKFLKV